MTHRIQHRRWQETRQQPGMLNGLHVAYFISISCIESCEVTLYRVTLRVAKDVLLTEALNLPPLALHSPSECYAPC